HRGVVVPAGSEIGVGDADRALGRLDAGGKKLGLLAGVQESGDPIFDFLGGGQDLLLIRTDQLLRLKVLEADVVEDSAVVQDVPLEGRADLAGEALGGK